MSADVRGGNDLLVGGIGLEAADFDDVAAGRRRDHDMSSGRQTDRRTQVLVGTEDDDFGNAEARQVDHRLALGADDVQMKFVVHVLARKEIVALVQRP